MQIWTVVFFHPICPSRDCSKAEKCRWSKLPESCARAYFSLQIIWSKRWCWTERHCYGVNASIISLHLSPLVVALYTHHACGFVLNGHFMCACIWQIWLIICYAQLYNVYNCTLKGENLEVQCNDVVPTNSSESWVASALKMFFDSAFPTSHRDKQVLWLLASPLWAIQLWLANQPLRI